MMKNEDVFMLADKMTYRMTCNCIKSDMNYWRDVAKFKLMNTH